MKRSGPLKRKTPLKRVSICKSKVSSQDNQWSLAVRTRDGFVCQWPDCGYVNRSNHAHHIASRKQRPDLKYEVSNGVTLCWQHHRYAHEHPPEARNLGFIDSTRYELNRLKSFREGK